MERVAHLGKRSHATFEVARSLGLELLNEGWTVLVHRKVKKIAKV